MSVGVSLARAWHAAQGFRLAGRPSHTDLMVEALAPDGGAMVVAVEGKVRESPGPVVAVWHRDVEGEASAAFFAAMGGPPFEPGKALPLGERLAIELWAAGACDANRACGDPAH